MKGLNKKILVTGAGGFIGSHLVEALVEKGAKVRAFVHYNASGRWGWLDYVDEHIKNSIEVFAGDIRDLCGVKQAMNNIDVVFHLAALIGIPYSYSSPDSYVSTNTTGTLNILQTARELGVQKVIHTSTSEVYGSAQFVPITEGHPINPQSPYAATKAGADFLALAFHRSFELPVTVIRPFNTYGPRQSARAFIPTVISQALTRDRLIMGSLSPVRDLTFVKDSVEGFISVGLCDKVVGKVVNLGIGSGHTIRAVVETVLTILDKKDMPIEQDLARIRPAKSEVTQLISDNSIATEICGWQPRYSLAQGLAETIEWIRENIHMYRPDTYAV